MSELPCGIFLLVAYNQICNMEFQFSQTNIQCITNATLQNNELCATFFDWMSYLVGSVLRKRETQREIWRLWTDEEERTTDGEIGHASSSNNLCWRCRRRRRKERRKKKKKMNRLYGRNFKELQLVKLLEVLKMTTDSSRHVSKHKQRYTKMSLICCCEMLVCEETFS